VLNGVQPRHAQQDVNAVEHAADVLFGEASGRRHDQIAAVGESQNGCDLFDRSRGNDGCGDYAVNRKIERAGANVLFTRDRGEFVLKRNCGCRTRKRKSPLRYVHAVHVHAIHVKKAAINPPQARTPSAG
jgi:hypothetical protein